MRIDTFKIAATEKKICSILLYYHIREIKFVAKHIPYHSMQ